MKNVKVKYCFRCFASGLPYVVLGYPADSSTLMISFVFSNELIINELPHPAPHPLPHPAPQRSYDVSREQNRYVTLP